LVDKMASLSEHLKSDYWLEYSRANLLETMLDYL